MSCWNRHSVKPIFIRVPKPEEKWNRKLNLNFLFCS